VWLYELVARRSAFSNGTFRQFRKSSLERDKWEKREPTSGRDVSAQPAACSRWLWIIRRDLTARFWVPGTSPGLWHRVRGTRVTRCLVKRREKPRMEMSAPGVLLPAKATPHRASLEKPDCPDAVRALSLRCPDAVPTIWSRLSRLSRLVPPSPAQSCSVSLGDRTLLRRCRAGQTDTGLVSVPRHVVRMSGVESRLRIQNVLARSHFFAIPILGNACSPRTRPVPLVRVKRARAAPTLLERHGRLEGVRLELRHL
jgi:hypothetical protein